MSDSISDKAQVGSPDSGKKNFVLKPLYLELESVSAALGLGVATIQRLVRQDSFPKPRQLSGRRVGWLVREIEEWAEARPVSNLPPPPNTSGRRRSSG